MARASELRQEHQREFVVEDYTDMDNIQVIHLEYERD